MNRLALLMMLLFSVSPVSLATEPDRAKLLTKLEAAMGPMPPDSRKVPPDVKILSEERIGTSHLRIKLTYASEAGDRVPAWLLKPIAPPNTRHPAMLCLHQTINIGKDEPVGLGQQPSKQQALHLVERGYVCLAPDYPSFGEYPYDFQKAFQQKLYQSGTMKAIWNNRRAVDLLQSLPDVDPERIGVIGHSLGGHNSLFTAAFEERLKVAVSSCGFNSFHKYYQGNLKGWSSDRYMPRVASVYKNDPKLMPFDFDDVLLAIYPRAVFAMSPLRDGNFEVSGVKDVLAKVEPVYKAGGHADKLKAIYPDAGHEWPEQARREAYEFVDSILKKKSP